MKQCHFSLRFFLFGGMLCLLICVVTLAAPSAESLSGKIREFPIPTAGSDPVGITAGPDGTLWFTQLSYPLKHRIICRGCLGTFPIHPG